MDDLAVDNVANYFRLAYLHERSELKEASMYFIANNFRDVMKTEGMLEFSWLFLNHYYENICISIIQRLQA